LAATKPTQEVDAVAKDVLAMIEGAELVALDIETTGLDPHKHALRLVQISTGADSYVIDSWSDEMPVEKIFSALAPKTVLAHNAKFEWSWVYQLYGIELEDIRDTMLISQVLAVGDKSVEVSLGAVARRELGQARQGYAGVGVGSRDAYKTTTRLRRPRRTGPTPVAGEARR